jgi:antitoxin (DNA-binding transcriptional repressor) of toxin-antitoxin stability system
MKTISIRALHLATGRWVRYAAAKKPVIVTDRGQRIAALLPFEASMAGTSLPDREATIARRSRIRVDSAVYQADMRARA